MVKLQKAVMIPISFILIGILFPTALAMLSVADSMYVEVPNGTSTMTVLVSDVVDSSVLMILTIILPIMGILSLALAYMKFK